MTELGEPLRPGNNAKIAVQDDTEKREEMDAVSKTKSYMWWTKCICMYTGLFKAGFNLGFHVPH